MQQECIPVGCVPTAAMATTGCQYQGGSASREGSGLVKITALSQNAGNGVSGQERNSKEQESTPVGCIPPACRPYVPWWPSDDSTGGEGWSPDCTC